MRKNRFWAALPGLILVVVIGGFGLSFLTDTDGRATEMDGRYLATFPRPSLEGIADGSWQRDFEAFTQDRLAFREAMLEVHAFTVGRVMGQQEVGGVWRDPSTNTLLPKPKPSYEGTESLVQAAGRMGAVARGAGIPIVFAYVPSKQEALVHLLPPHWSLQPALEAKQQLLAAYGANGVALDLTRALGASPNNWYLTDHHWSTRGARRAANEVIRTLQRAGVKVGGETSGGRVVANYPPFIGSAGRSLTLGAIREPDHLVVTEPDTSASMCSGRTFRRLRCGVPVLDDAGARDADPYANRYRVFLGGDAGVTVIKGTGRGTLLMTKDSFGNPLVTMFASRFDTIVAIDERHYKGVKLSKLVDKYKPNSIVMLHSAASMYSPTFDSSLWG